MRSANGVVVGAFVEVVVAEPPALMAVPHCNLCGAPRWRVGALCRYECVKVLDIPGDKDEAYFTDYSAMDIMRDSAGRDLLMVASQVPLLLARCLPLSALNPLLLLVGWQVGAGAKLC